MEIRRFAAIDIGSNSVRLLIENVLENGGAPVFKKSALIRVPVRLGGNAFTDHKIPEVAVRNLLEAMLAFKHLMRANDVLHYKGCATAAMREASNGEEIVQRIREECGIEIEIINGKTEAAFIFKSQHAALASISENFVFVDVGGGSTEITIFSKGKLVGAKSFSIGTIRMLQNQVGKKQWNGMKEWLKSHIRPLKNFSLVGSGGNINRMAKLVQLKPGKSIPFVKLQHWVDELKEHSYEERMKIFDLNPDRADVIVPAGEIFLSLMKWSGSTEIFVPKVGLGDGIVREAYREWLAGKKKLPH